MARDEKILDLIKLILAPDIFNRNQSRDTQPSLSPVGEILQEGQVVSVEPGQYYRGVGAVRIEDLGVVTRTGFDRITNFSRDMIL